MRASIIIAAHNEGDRLWRTVASCVETSAGLDCEIVVADDASWDGSVEETLKRFQQVRVVRHDERRGASPTKDLGARHARGETLIFLDGHTKPEPGAIERLIEDVERLKGDAIITPTVTGLCVTRWKSLDHQKGHGYSLELERLDCAWLPLNSLRPHPHRGRMFYECPALIGCAFAVHRELYDDLRGFDPHMLCWGVEDLDFGLKSWLMGHPILHDPEPVIGHRFQQRFDNFEVPIEQLLVNQLRLARKNFTEAVWSDWLERCRARNSGTLTNHPEGLWARVWQLFTDLRPSAEHERAHLLARRVHDEFWFAERFALPWPKLQAERFESSLLRGMESSEADPSPSPSRSPSPSPPPCECSVTGIAPSDPATFLDKNITFTAEGEHLDEVSWSAPGGSPATGTGSSFTTKWDSVGTKTVTASCCDTSESIDVAVMRARIKRDGQDVTDQTINITDGQKISLSVELENGGDRAFEVRWTIPGSAIKNYTLDTNTVTAIPDGDLSQKSISWYWTIESTKQTVTAMVTVGGVSTSVETTFDVSRPVVTVAIATASVLPYDQDPNALPDFSKDLKVGFGKPLPGAYGIHMTGTATIAGTFAWPQIVNTATAYVLWKDDAAPEGHLANATNQLDVIQGGPRIRTGPTDFDAPFWPVLERMMILNSNQDFSTYVLFRPGAATNIFVPVKRVNWHWSFSGSRGAENVYSFIGDPDVPANPMAQDLTAYPPAWSGMTDDDPNGFLSIVRREIYGTAPDII